MNGPDKNRFINPYSFVPLGPPVIRDASPSQASMTESALSGSFLWVLRFDSDLVLDANASPTRVGTAPLTYPGSSLRGVLRSLHEVVAGGCLRAVDLDYRPVHREPMSAYARVGHTLAVVKGVDKVTGAVTSVQKTKRHVWVREDLVHVALGRPARSGDTVRIDSSAIDALDEQPSHHRMKVDNQDLVVPGKTWVVHLADAGARKPNHPFYIAAGEIDPAVASTPIRAQQWKEYVDLCQESSDLLNIRHPKDTSGTTLHSPQWPRVTVKKRVTDCDASTGQPKRDPSGKEILKSVDVGERRQVDGWLSEGDTVWLTAEGRLKPSAIWRHFGEYTVRDRIGSHAPCNSDDLCPSCALFGSIDPESGGDSQKGYASRVRVSFGRSVRRKTPTQTAHAQIKRHELPPLRAPKPSSGGFYLDHSSKGARPFLKYYKADNADDHVTRAHWGSRLDFGPDKEETDPGFPEPDLDPRPIRGRKFYWHGQVADQTSTPRQDERPHQRNGKKRQGAARMVAVRPTLAVTVAFDNLSLAELGTLLLAANPNLLSHGDDLRIHVGGGKPLGFGTAHPEIRGLDARTAVQRYAGVPGPDSTIAEEALESARSNHSASLAHATRFLTKILQKDAVAAERIWYPPKGSFDQQGQPAFDRSFDFFAQASGGRKGDLKLLPDLLADDQTLPNAAVGRPAGGPSGGRVGRGGGAQSNRGGRNPQARRKPGSQRRSNPQ